MKLFIDGERYMATVLHYQRACPMRETGSGFGDAEPPTDEEIDFELTTYVGDKKVTDENLIARAEKMLLDEYRKK